MARTRTLDQLIGDVKAEGGYNRSQVFTDTLLTRWINQAIAEVYELLADAFSGHYLTDVELSTVIGQKYVNLPSTFWRLVRLDLKHSARSYTTLRRMSILEEHDYEDVGLWNAHGPVYAYYLKAGTIQLSRTPTKVDTLAMVYLPHSTDLVSGSSTFDGINGWEDLVVQLVLRKCYQREKKPTIDCLKEIDRQMKRISIARQKRNCAEPMPAPDLGRWGP